MQDLGKIIRKIRHAKKMNIRELSEKVGVSKSLISQVERGDVFPSLTTLDRIAVVLKVPISEFFMIENSGINENEIIVRKKHRKKIKLNDSKVIYNLLTPSLKKSIEFLIIEVPPYVYKEQVKTTFKHKGEEYFIVLEGQLNLHIGDQEYVLYEGDSGCFDSNTKHTFENKTGSKTVYLIAATSSFFSS